MAERTRLAGWLGEPDLDDGFAFSILPAMPGNTLLALGTGHDLVLPVHLELRDIEGVWGARLPTGIHMHWPNQVYPIVVTTLQDRFALI